MPCATGNTYSSSRDERCYRCAIELKLNADNLQLLLFSNLVAIGLQRMFLRHVTHCRVRIFGLKSQFFKNTLLI